MRVIDGNLLLEFLSCEAVNLYLYWDKLPSDYNVIIHQETDEVNTLNIKKQLQN